LPNGEGVLDTQAMHIANGLINQPTCVVTSGLAVASLIWAARKARETATPDNLKLMPVVAATVFAGQLVNFSLGGGISGHLLGSALATILLGPALAMISMGAVVLAQCLLLGDGGVTALGANFLSMGVVGVVAADLVWNKVRGHSSKWVAAGLASWVSVVAASVACTVFLSFSGIGSYQFFSEMLASHAVIGLSEAGLTVGALFMIQGARAVRQQIAVLSCIAASMIAFFPFSSALPDGLEAALSGAGHAGMFATGWITGVLAVGIGLQVYFRSVRKLVVQRIQSRS